MGQEHRPALRVSDVERERTVAALGDHHALGRLTYEEFLERMDRALRGPVRSTSSSS